jgi:hypothetical protein
MLGLAPMAVQSLLPAIGTIPHGNATGRQAIIAVHVPEHAAMPTQQPM